MRPDKEPFNSDKFRRAVHYIIWKAGNRNGFGATKINKVLWFSDARMYVLHKRSITGAHYIREKHGPVPREFVRTRESLKAQGVIDYKKDDRQSFFRSNIPPDTSIFSQEELRIIDHWIDVIDREHTAQSISEKTHDYGWQIARQGEEIPLIAILAEQNIREPNAEELAWAHEKVRQRGLK